MISCNYSVCSVNSIKINNLKFIGFINEFN
jgi:hypothetical protein